MVPLLCTPPRPRRRLVALAAAAAALLAGCTVGPDYVRPPVETPVAWKETGPWKAAEPQPADSRAAWWEAYGDTTLNTLVEQANAANQTLRIAEAQYRQAAALADSARAALYPTVGVSAGATRARSNTNGTLREGTTRSVGFTASWAPDLWGAVRRSIESNTDSSDASADDLAAARLSIQSTVVQDYLQIRILDRQRDLYYATVEAYTRALQLVQAQYNAGTALRSDVALAQTQLKTAQAQGVDLEVARNQFEHALAVLTGRPPAAFGLPQATPDKPFEARLPATPPMLPSELLQRRPDIASAERRAAAANANIGVAKAAFYPSLGLTASGGLSSLAMSTLFDTPSRVWSLGAALSQTLFDGGLRTARNAQAVAAYDAAAAQYKQTVLNAFAQVEDNLSTLRVLENESVYQKDAVEAAQLAERLALVQYRAGSTTYLSVVTAQTLSLTNQRTAVQLLGRQLAASVSLVAAIGGGFTAPEASPGGSPGSGSAVPPAAGTSSSTGQAATSATVADSEPSPRKTTP
jgi:NodT family efflux transporter outer membrane factor (OMF) lipoprotein